MKKLLYLLFLAIAFTPVLLRASTVDARFNVITNNGSHLTVAIELKASSSFTLGTSNVVFYYNSSNLTYNSSGSSLTAPFDASSGSNYNSPGTNISDYVGETDLNFDLASTGGTTGTISGSTWTEIGRIDFTVTNSSGTPDLAFDVSGAVTDIFNDVGTQITNSFSNSGTTGNPTALPVTLYNFSAAAQNTDAVLSWSTISEYSNQGFTVERSLDGLNWTNLSFVPSKALNGNSQAKLTYSYTDENAGSASPVVFYRLIQQDVNGKPTVEGVRSVRFSSGNDISLSVYPNPASNYVNVTTDRKEPVVLSLLDIQGHQLLGSQFVSSTRLDVSNIRPGTYNLVIRALDGTFVKQSALVIAR